MKRIRFKRVVLILIVAIALVGAMLFVLSWWGQEDARLQSLPPLEPPALQLPSLPLTPQTMTDAQKQAAVEQAGEDARLAALAAGQSEGQAQAAAEQARIQARNIFYPTPSKP